MRRLLIIGEAPGPIAALAGLPALSGLAGQRLAKLVGYEFVSDFADDVNVLDYYPGSNGKGSRFPIDEARAAAARLDLRGRVVLVAGKRAALALGIQKAEYLTWIRHRGALVAVVPHPSGVNRWWNEPRQARRAKEFLERALLRARRSPGRGALRPQR